jgi:hypothetical protein
VTVDLQDVDPEAPPNAEYMSRRLVQGDLFDQLVKGRTEVKAEWLGGDRSPDEITRIGDAVVGALSACWTLPVTIGVTTWGTDDVLVYVDDDSQAVCVEHPALGVFGLGIQ